MNKIKNIFNSLVFAFILAGTLILGGTLLSYTQSQPHLSQAATQQEEISNQLPPYFLIDTQNRPVYSSQSDSLYLMNNQTRIDITFTNGWNEAPGNDAEGHPQPYKNPAFFPNLEDKTSYYYFGEYSSQIALYRNRTNQDLNKDNLSAYEDENLLKGKSTDDFVRNGEFKIEDYTLTPSLFKMSFNLDTTKPDVEFNTPASTSVSDFEGTTITLNKEGYYTLAIPYSYVYFEDGEVANYSNDVILYTFMVFNSTTYLDTASNLPNTEVPSFVQTSQLINNANYSRYYFFNYDDAPLEADASDNVSNLPYIKYNPTHYELSVEYINIDDESTVYNFVLSDGHLVADGQPQDCPIYPVQQEEDAYLYFNDLGTYNISFHFIYQSENSVFALPISTLSQKLYVFGYQAFYTTQEKDPDTHETQAKELKYIDPASPDRYTKSADITSLVNSTCSQRTLDVNADAVKADITEGHKLDSITPISTNQTPVKFRSNQNVTLNEGVASKLYKVTFNDSLPVLDDGTAYAGENISTSGTYLLIVTYNFADFLSSSGTQQRSYRHYQIFYFTITEFTPSVTVVDESGKALYVNSFTNKDVYIADDSAGADYDASVSITLDAYDYTNSRYFFQDQPITSFVGGNFSGIKYVEDLKDENGGIDSIAGKPGLHISTDSPYHNAKFTVKIKSATSQNPSIKHFTIDTKEIGQITARTTSYVSSTSYAIERSLLPDESGAIKTNQPIIFSWNEKASSANTFGFYKFFPLQTLQYYQTDRSNNSLLKSFLEYNGKSGVLPINSTLNLDFKAGWTNYANTIAFSDARTIPSSFVRNAPGLYLFEVYDEAGNYNFEIFLLDNTSPMFVLSTIDSSRSTSLSLLGTSFTITISDQYTYQVLWGSKKGIYISGLSSTTAADGYLPTEKNQFTKYEQDGLDTSVNNVLLEKVYNFFNSSSQVLTSIQADFAAPEGGVPSYDGRYLTIDILPNAYIKHPDSDIYVSTPTYANNINSLDIELFKDENPNEGPYKFLIRDQSNTKYTSVDAQGHTTVGDDGYKRGPSAYTTVNLTSDSSKLQFLINQDEENPISPAGYSQVGKFYKDDEDNLYRNTANGREISDYNYRYTYYTPVRTSLPITLSFVPYASNGESNASLIESLTMDYYPFVKTPQTVQMQGHAQNETYPAYAYYYTLSSTPQFKDFPIFKLTAENQPGLVQDAVQTYQLARSGDTVEPGKYVFRRVYSKSGNTQGQGYDYYERTLTLIVDRYELISPDEQVSNPDRTQTSTESVVGGDIQIFMYSTQGSNAQSFISLAYPNYNPQTGLNSGSLYTSSNMQETSTPPTAFVQSNKTPVSVLIPKYKYTTFSQYDFDTNSFNVFTNEDVSYYGGFAIVTTKSSDGLDTTVYQVYTSLVYKDQGDEVVLDTDNSMLLGSFNDPDSAQAYLKQQQANASVVEYEIYAKIRYQETESSTNYTWYRSSGADENNYLKFYRTSGEYNNFDEDERNRVTSFTQAGIYVVTLYQANNQSSETNGNAAFNSLYKFSFKITSPTPDFTVLTENGGSLKSLVDTNSLGSEFTYYTNQKNLRVQWEDSSSDFIAKIDQSSILTQRIYSNTVDAERPVTEIFTDETNPYLHWFNVDLSQLWQNGNRLRISMKYEGYPDTNRVVKYVRIDYTAPTENLVKLMDKTASATAINERSSLLSRLFQEQNTRLLRDSTDQELLTSNWTEANLAANMEQVSYSYSTGSGNYRSFAYTVDETFFSDLYTSLTDPSNRTASLQDAYIRLVAKSTTRGVLSGYTQTTKGGFSEYDATFSNIKYDALNLISGNFYEIVETDLAGNMVVYLVYYQDAQADSNAITYSNNANGQTTLTTSAMKQNFNIYSNSGFEISELNYQDDVWGVYRFVIQGVTSYYLKSPWLMPEDGDLYEFSLAGNTQLVPRRYSDLFDGFTQSATKQEMYLANRTNGSCLKVNISIADISLSASRHSDNGSATLEILDVPSLEQIEGRTVYVFPVQISVARGQGSAWNYFLLEAKNPSGDPNNWSNFDSSFLHFDASSGNLAITVTVEQDISAQFRFDIVDNFGNTFTEFVLTNEEAFEPVVSDTVVYAFTESDLSTTYLSSSTLSYQFNHNLYGINIVAVYEDGLLSQSTLSAIRITDNISRITLSTDYKPNYDRVCVIQLYELTDPSKTILRTVNLRVYNKLPVLSTERETEGQNNIYFVDTDGDIIDQFENIRSLSVVFDDKVITSSATAITTFSNNVSVYLQDGQTTSTPDYEYNRSYPYSAFASVDGVSWQNFNDQVGTGYLLSGTGSYYILVKYDDPTIFNSVYRLFMVNILNSSSVSYYFHVDGMPVEARQDFRYTATDTGEEIDTVYMINVNYAEKDAKVSIEPNVELNTVWTSIRLLSDSASSVQVEIWKYTSDITKDSSFAVIYIGESKDILNYFRYENAQGSRVDLLQTSSDPANPSPIIAEETEVGFKDLKLVYYNYYGIKENTIQPEVRKLFNGQYVLINTVAYPDERDENLNYIYLNRAGSYRITFMDSCDTANIHNFGRSSYINITFLNNVPYTITYTDPATQQEVVSEPINRGIYNGTVTLSLTTPGQYFASGYPIISVLKDGKEYNVTKQGANNYVFTETGFYTVSFTAQSTDQRSIRSEDFVFSIINPNESRYAFEFANYGTYYIKSIQKDGIDVTERFNAIMDTPKVTYDGVHYYLPSLQVSYFDEKTGSGNYIVTIETGEATYANTTATSFTFAFRINLAYPPITVSLEENGSTSGPIEVTFNIRTLYNLVGDCRIRIPGRGDIVINAESLNTDQEVATYTITENGTNYIQVYSLSGTLLYSYKVTKTEPLNAWTIIAIVLSVIVVGVIIFVTIKLRKRLKVK